ncbi:hypothetical protein [uncultured Zhongshania sp.]|uniref:hypothetical protein n=1 Tax=uncultured Zhongshania sp. TaxID=1642288 RepID=UPI0025D421CC|nr:hypothetical protein [uncultured Zhongshania sp.]
MANWPTIGGESDEHAPEANIPTTAAPRVISLHHFLGVLPCLAKTTASLLIMMLDRIIL